MDKLFGNKIYTKSERVIHNNKALDKILEEVLLFDGSSSSAVTLSEDINNFKKVIIYFTALGKKYSLVVNGNGLWGVTINQSAGFGSYYALRIAGAHFYIEGKTITPSIPAQNYTIDLKTNGTFQFFDTVTTLTINKVVGYR